MIATGLDVSHPNNYQRISLRTLLGVAILGWEGLSPGYIHRDMFGRQAVCLCSPWYSMLSPGFSPLFAWRGWS